MKILLFAAVLAGLVLAAKAQPVITSSPASLTVNAGSTASFSVGATDANTNANLSYQWTNSTGVISGATSATYTIENVSANQAGVYGVIVSSADGTNTSAATLAVLQGTIVNFLISGFASGPSNVMVELFDHDKPATVENFIHYIRSVAYSNLFLDRLIPGFVLQSGDDDATDRTNTSSGVNANNIDQTYVSTNAFNPPLPPQVANEYNLGPIVGNTAGTLAMALPSGNVNGATSAFFFNLVDNSFLDSPANGGPYTVFGRVIGGGPVLDYFNNTNYFFKPAAPNNQLPPTNIYDDGIFDLAFLDTNATALTDLPVNFHGTNVPSNTNLFFVDFSFSGPQPVVDTTPPTAAISFPAAGQFLTNGYDLTALGTANDNIGLAVVNYSLNPQNGANNGAPLTGVAEGTTNWSFDLGELEPGTYNLVVTPQDGAGNLGAPAEIDNIIVTAVLTNGLGAVSLTNQATGAVTANAVGAYMASGTEYVLGAQPGAGQLFANWSVSGAVSISPNVPINMQDGLVLTATFISNTIPNSIAFTSPPLNGSLTNGANLLIQGTIAGLTNLPVSISCLVCSYVTATPSYWLAIGPALQTSGNTDWSVTETNVLAPGQYMLQVVAQDSMGNTTLITNQITILSTNGPPTITSPPANLTVNAGSAAYFSVTANNATTYQWTNALGEISGATNATYAIDNVSANQAGIYGVIVSSTGGTVTSSATLTVVQGTIVNFLISGFASGPSNVMVELFDHDKPATVENFVHYIRSGAYSNLFFDRLLPGFVLQSGDDDAADRTNTAPDPVAVNIYNTYVSSLHFTNPSIPFQVDSEYYVGPIVSNTAGTLALALPSGNADGGNSAFFFNLVDNPSLDSSITGGGPFTVFGRVIGGSPVLDYFNNTNNFFKPAVPTNLVFASNIFDEGIFDAVYLNTNTTALTDLPVNFHGTNIPCNTNLFFVDFSFPGPQPLVDTTPPAAAITFPAANQLLTNGDDLTVQGTANDNIALALVFSTLYPQNGANNDLPLGDDANGTTNWSFDYGLLEPGIYNLKVTPQDGAGNLGNAAENNNIIITAVMTNGGGTVSMTNITSGGFTANAVGAYLVSGSDYITQAHPGKNQLFANWNSQGNIALSPNVPITMGSSTFLTATFISNTIPNSIAFTSPSLNSSVTNGTNLVIQGTISGLSNTPVNISCLIATYETATPPFWLATGPALQTSGTVSWSVTNTNDLAPGVYLSQVTATDAKGNTTLITNQFTVLTGLGLTTNGPGTITLAKSAKGVTPPLGNYLLANQQYTLTATPEKGASFYSWSDGVNTTLNPVKTFTMTPGLSLTATFVSNNLPTTLKITSPLAGAQLTSAGNFQLAGTVSSSLAATQIMCQLFFNSNAITPPIAANSANGAWSAATQTNLAPGRSYTALVTASNAKGGGAFIKQNFSVLARLTLTTNVLVASSRSPGSITPNDNGKYYQVGTSVPLTAKPGTGYLFAYWTIDGSTNYSDPLTISIADNQTVTANFASNYYQNVGGTYNGLFYPTNGPVTATNSGYFTMTVTTGGLATLHFNLPQHAFNVEGELPYYGSVPGARTQNVPGYFLAFSMAMDLTNGTDSLTGLVYNYYTGWYDSLTAYRVAAALTTASDVVPGNYVLSIPGDPSATNDQPGGDGYATYSISSKGAVALAGYLADGTSISQSTGVSKDGIWPFFVPLYKNAAGISQGVILGWQTNSIPTNYAGQVLAWSKPRKIGAYYTNGFNVTTNTLPINYTPPVAHTSYQITFGGGTLANLMTNLLTVSAAGLFTPLGATNTAGTTNKLTITLGKTGVITGQFINPANKKTLLIKGAFISPSQGGSGYFLDTDDQSGYFQITATP